MVDRIVNPLNAIGYSDWGIKRTIREAENVSRWNPWKCHEWMEEARDRMDQLYVESIHIGICFRALDITILTNFGKGIKLATHQPIWN